MRLLITAPYHQKSAGRIKQTVRRGALPALEVTGAG